MDNLVSEKEQTYIKSQGLHDITGCCFERKGYYCGYQLNGGDAWEMEFWAGKRVVKTAIRDLNRVLGHFEVQAERDRVADIIQNLYPLDAPFDYTIRFDFSDAYLRVNKVSFILDNLLLNASLKYRSDERQNQTLTGGGKDDSKKPVEILVDDKGDQAKKSFKENLQHLTTVISDKDWIYTRSKFESELKLEWCSGNPKQPIKREEMGDKVPCNKPGKCVGKVFTVEALRNIIDREKPKNLDSDHWYLNIEEPLAFSCEGVRQSTSLKTLEASVVVPRSGFIFAALSKTQNKDEITVARYGYYLLDDKLLELPTASCAGWEV